MAYANATSQKKLNATLASNNNLREKINSAFNK
jgi:hypothetical protein